MKPAGEVLRRGDYVVEPVDLAMCRTLVELFHYAKGGANTGTVLHGLFHRDDHMSCLGIAWWMPPTRRAAESVHPEWQRVLTLTRLVIAPEVPTNGASFVLARSVRQLRASGAVGGTRHLRRRGAGPHGRDLPRCGVGVRRATTGRPGLHRPERAAGRPQGRPHDADARRDARARLHLPGPQRQAQVPARAVKVAFVSADWGRDVDGTPIPGGSGWMRAHLPARALEVPE